MTLFYLLFLSFNSFSVDLLQEEKEIKCSDSKTQVLIDKKDRYVIVDGQKYKLVEFLDSAILAKKDNSHILLQVLPHSKALLIKGKLHLLQESQCSDTGASKTCISDSFEKLFWSSAKFEFKLQDKNNLLMDVFRYGVYPNDGTYFLARKSDNGLGLIDYGSDIQIVFGKISDLNCEYKN